MIYPKKFEHIIGFSTIREEISKRCMGTLGQHYCGLMHFSTSLSEVSRWLGETNEFLSVLQSRREFPLNYFFDMRKPLRAISAPGSHMSEQELFDLLRSLRTVSEIISFFRRDDGQSPLYPNLTKLTAPLNDFPEVTRLITSVLDNNGYIKDNASPLLFELKSAIARATASINTIMRRVVAQAKQSGILDKDTSPSVRDGRLVIPVPPAHKRKIRGIVHDESASGKTVFIEPEEIVEANNHIREAEAEVKREILRILTEVTDGIRPHADELLEVYSVLGQIDFIRAKALFAADVDAQMPHLHKQPGVEWYGAVHPVLLLSLRQQGKQVVPLNIELSAEKQRIIIISGPNAGGKSVCLKTVGVVQYMAQCGVLPTVRDNSHIGIFKDIFADIGDQQSIEDDLSTYSSHLTNMKLLITRGGKDSLLLIDEFGSGTEPQIGGAIAQAILEQLNTAKMWGVITTHYQNLKHYADETEGIVNGAMLYDRQHMTPLFQLSIGYPGSSFAIEIARKIGLPKAVIDYASDIVGSDYINMDKYLLDIVRDRRYWEKKRHEVHLQEKRLNEVAERYNEQVDKLRTERRDIIGKAREEAKHLLDESRSQIEHVIGEIRQAQAEKERTREMRQQLEDFKKRIAEQNEPLHEPRLKKLATHGKNKKQTQKSEASTETLRPLKPGDFVTLKGSETVGTIMEIDGKWALVAFGALKTRAELSRLEHTLKKPNKQPKPTVTHATAQSIRERQLAFHPELDVRGMRGIDAVQAVTYFIDDAQQFDYKRVRILHGTGTGALREVIRQYLNTVPGVVNYHDEHVQFGGAGITIVNLE